MDMVHRWQPGSCRRHGEAFWCGRCDKIHTETVNAVRKLDVFCEGGDRTTSRPSLEMFQEHVLCSLNLFQTIADEKNYKAFLGQAFLIAIFKNVEFRILQCIEI